MFASLRSSIQSHPETVSARRDDLNKERRRWCKGRTTVNAIECVTDRPVTPALNPAELDAIKARQRATWASGDFSVIGTTLQLVGESLCEAVDLRSGSKVLDVAAGNGNCSLAAARRWCEVTSTDYVPALLEGGKRRAEAERLPITFQEADAEALPFADGSFDVVLSSFGIQFTPNHVRDRLGAAARLPQRGANRLGELDAAWLHRPAVRCHRTTRAAAEGCNASVSLGLGGLSRATLRRCGLGDPHHAPRLQLPVSVAQALDRRVPHLVRPGAQGVRWPDA